MTVTAMSNCEDQQAPRDLRPNPRETRPESPQRMVEPPVDRIALNADEGLSPPLWLCRVRLARGTPSRWNPRAPRPYINLGTVAQPLQRPLALAVPGWCCEWVTGRGFGTTDTLWGGGYQKYRTLHQKQPTTWQAAWGKTGAFCTFLLKAKATCFWWACAHVLSPQAFQTAKDRAANLAEPVTVEQALFYLTEAGGSTAVAVGRYRLLGEQLDLHGTDDKAQLPGLLFVYSDGRGGVQPHWLPVKSLVRRVDSAWHPPLLVDGYQRRKQVHTDLEIDAMLQQLPEQVDEPAWKAEIRLELLREQARRVKRRVRRERTEPADMVERIGLGPLEIVEPPQELTLYDEWLHAEDLALIAASIRRYTAFELVERSEVDQAEQEEWRVMLDYWFRTWTKVVDRTMERAMVAGLGLEPPPLWRSSDLWTPTWYVPEGAKSERTPINSIKVVGKCSTPYWAMSCLSDPTPRIPGLQRAVTLPAGMYRPRWTGLGWGPGLMVELRPEIVLGLEMHSSFRFYHRGEQISCQDRRLLYNGCYNICELQTLVTDHSVWRLELDRKLRHEDEVYFIYKPVRELSTLWGKLRRINPFGWETVREATFRHPHMRFSAADKYPTVEAQMRAQYSMLLPHTKRHLQGVLRDCRNEAFSKATQGSKEPWITFCAVHEDDARLAELMPDREAYDLPA